MNNYISVLDLFNTTVETVANIKEVSGEGVLTGVVLIGASFFIKRSENSGSNTTNININFYLDKDTEEKKEEDRNSDE
ncbi:hypothetical protein HNP21_006287 [Bacillus aryabhattai]|uniref:Uncharacterized protein n=1 Tax=Priestia aryabhattai TaxID=412384 RepID=A0A7W3NHL3_PRIAR|nr:hypothetical protein [Priestia aryabhattai]MBA9043109.1 hypothetical protein [Priestia aryabhattai]